MDTKATGIDDAPVQAYKYRSCAKNIMTNQQDTLLQGELVNWGVLCRIMQLCTHSFAIQQLRPCSVPKFFGFWVL